MMNGDEGADIGATDLFFGLAAVLIVLLSVTSQTLRAAVVDRVETQVAALAEMTETAAVWLVLARADGIILHRPGGAPRAVALDEILTGAAESWAREARSPIWVGIEDTATDSAFLLETTLARAGVREVHRVRLPGACARPRLISEGMGCDG